MRSVRKMMSVQLQPAKFSGLGSGSCLQPSREAGVQEAATERFSQGPVVWLLRLYQRSGY